MNLFDTAEVYGFGRSEYLCGKFRRDYEGSGKDGIVLGETRLSHDLTINTLLDRSSVSTSWSGYFKADR